MKKNLIAILLAFYTMQSDELSEEISTNPQETTKKQNLIQKIQAREKELSVPRETVPVQKSKFLIDTPIPKTAHYLPFLQPLLNIELGTLPNPIGVSIIGSFTDENYRITKFNGTMGRNIGGAIVDGLTPQVFENKDKILQAINKSKLPFLTKTFLRALVQNIDKPALQNTLRSIINDTVGAGETKEWKLSEGKAHTRTGAVGVKADVFLFPFMNLFFTTAYLNVEQSTNVGNATIPLKKPLGNKLNSITFPVGTISNDLDGFLVMGGTNLMIGYKGFFASFMVSGGYVRLDDLKNNITGFVEKPFMYLAPRIGYSYHGVFTAHFGVQRIELFGETKGNDLSKITGGLVEGYSVAIEKFPVNFLVGAQFMFMRDLGLSVEYVGSPDVNGFNAEIAYRF